MLLSKGNDYSVEIISITIDVSFSSLPSATVVAERLCFHRYLCPRGGGGACMARGGVAWGICMAGRGRAWQERRPLQRTARILLECILVFFLCSLSVRSKRITRSFDETIVQMPSVGWFLFSSKPCDSDRSCDRIDHVAMAHRT